jgi:hypothetical protein
MDAKFGGNKFGGQKFGGQTHGGNTFGGNQYGASQELARLLINAQAPPPVGLQDFAQTPAQAPMQAPQAAPLPAAPLVPPPAAMLPQAPAMAPAVDPMAAPTVPPMPETVRVGMDAKADVLKALEEMQRLAFQNAPAPWTVNQGGLADQRR